MIEKVNPSHPDKVADRIAGAIVDLGYKKQEKPKIAVEVLIGHNNCSVIIETSVNYSKKEIRDIVKRITKVDNWKWNIKIVEQDIHLSNNQSEKVRCGDNGIFKGVPLTDNEKLLSNIAKAIYKRFPTDGKYISSVDDNKIIICQSNATNEQISEMYPIAIINPLGEWTGGTDVDTGATNRKLGSDMAQSVTGGGLHGKDLSKADVSVNIYAFKKAQETGQVVSLCCAIGDETIDGKPYSEIVEEAREYINSLGGFEKFAEWGLF